VVKVSNTHRRLDAPFLLTTGRISRENAANTPPTMHLSPRACLVACLLLAFTSIAAAQNHWPTSTISANTTSITAGSQVTLTVNANDVDGDLYYINIDEVSPNAGYYGQGYNTGTEVPPGGSAGVIDGSQHTSASRVLVLTINTAGSYVFKGMASDNTGSGWQPSSNTVTITVASSTLPTITRQPQSRSLTLGFDALFTVNATGPGTLSYQWQKGGTNLSGATNASYTIGNTTSGSAGNYTVVVTNSNGSVTSSIATLTLVDPNADADGDGIPDLTEIALGTHASTTASDSTNTQQQNVHRPL